MELKNDLIEKIQKLFSLSKSPNQNEAAAALQKAEAIMEKYNLSIGEVNYIEKDTKEKKHRIPEWETLIFTSVCYANNCQPSIRRGRGLLCATGRKVNVFLSIKMFKYLVESVKRTAKEKCEGKGHKYNHDFKMAAADMLNERLQEYGARVSWAVDRDEEIKNIREYKKRPSSKKIAGEGFSYKNESALIEGVNTGKLISFNKQAGLNKTKFLKATKAFEKPELFGGKAK
ncbi:MAG: DUF2786 domain-containing protein [Spirochaetaceae bacterium]|nr:DUF2786 domain-containing protein [Spirochaetaceae bacterium]